MKKKELVFWRTVEYDANSEQGIIRNLTAVLELLTLEVYRTAWTLEGCSGMLKYQKIGHVFFRHMFEFQRNDRFTACSSMYYLPPHD